MSFVMQLEREYTDYEKRILQHDEDLRKAIKDSIEGTGSQDQVNKVLEAWRAEWKNAPYGEVKP